MAVADLLASRDQPSASRRAMRLEPVNAAYPAQLAHELEVTDPQTAQALFRQAVRLNSYDAAAWIDLGLLYEEQGFYRKPRVTCSMLRRSTLPGCLTGRSRTSISAASAGIPSGTGRKSSAAGPRRRNAHLAARLVCCSEGDGNPGPLQVRRPEVQRQFLWFLIAAGRCRRGQSVGHSRPRIERGSFVGGCPLRMRLADPAKAARSGLPLWNGLAAQHQIPFAAVKSGSGDPVRMGLRRQPLSRGFDWHSPILTASRVSQRESFRARLRIFGA